MAKNILILIAFIFYGSLCFAGEKSITMVIVGEDSDKNAAKRSGEIYKRVVTELQQSLINKNIYVVDEDMVAARLGFEYSQNRDKQSLIKALSAANNTNDAKVRSRFGVIFSVYPNVQEMSITRKLTARLRGQIYDLRNLRALSSFEIKSRETITLPKDASMCNALCVEEKIGDMSVSLSSDLGATLIDKFNEFLKKEVDREELTTTNNASSGKQSSEVLKNTYTVAFKALPRSKIVNAIDKLSSYPNVEIELIKSTATQRIYSVQARQSLIQMEKLLLDALSASGIKEKNVTLTSQD